MKIRPLLLLWTSLSFFHSTSPAQPMETWTSAVLVKNSLAPQPPEVLQTDSEDTFTRELVRVQWRQNDPIYLYVLLPKLTPHPPVVVYLYSYPSETDRYRDHDFCKLLTEGGMAAVGLVSALDGQRYHDRPMKEWFVSELPEALAASAHDVQMVLNYLESRGDVDVSRAGFFGEGSGAAIGILTAAVDRRIRALDLLAPWGDWPDWLVDSSLVPEDERSRYLRPEFLDRLQNLEPLRVLPQLRIPIRLQYLAESTVTPAEVEGRLRAAAPPQTVQPSRDRALGEYKATRGLRFLDWIKKTVNAPASSR